MNQELRQRVIGAVVVTALAAIFVPMLFDEPVNNSGQEVSELTIPKEPAIAETVDKLPDSPEAVTNPTTSTGQAEISPAENLEEPVNDKEVLSTDDLESVGNVEEEPDFEPSPDGLDTGVVEKGTTPADEEELAKPEKPSLVDEPEVIEKPKKTQPVVVKPTPAKKPPVSTKPVVSTKKIEAPTKSNYKKPDFVRWYLQAGSYSKKENAVSMSEKLRKKGIPVQVEPITVSGKGTVYRLKVGPELDKKRAAELKAKLDQQNIKSMMFSE
jgi:DedD protein